MIELNKILIVGRLTRDPETRSTASGSSVTNFSVAVNRRRGKDKEDETTFVEVEAWERTAEFIAKWFTKGKPIFLEGRLKMDRWEDKATGAKRSKLSMVAERAGFVSGDGEKKDGDGAPDPSRTRPASEGGGKEPPDDAAANDDLPF